MCKSTADLHGTVPLAVLAGEELVVCLQSIALVAEVLDDCFMGEVVTRRRVTAVAPVLRLSGRRTSWDKDKAKDKNMSAPCSTQTLIHLLTIAFNAARGLMGPGSQTGTDDADGAIDSVAGVTSVHQQCPGWERAPVSFGLVEQLSMLHIRRLSTT